jgi:hypothetical protein
LTPGDPDLPGDFRYGPPSATPLPNGGFAVAYESTYRTPENFEFYRITADILSSSGATLQGFTLATGSISNDVGPQEPDIAADGLGHIVAAWSTVLYATAEVRMVRFDLGGTFGQVIGLQDAEEGTCGWSPDVAANRAGAFAAAWVDSDCTMQHPKVAVQAFDAAGHPAFPSFRIRPEGAPDPEVQPQIGMDEQGGFVVLWTERLSGSPARRLKGQRFRPDGTAGSPRLDLGVLAAGTHAVLAVLPDGGFVVARDTVIRGRRQIRIRRYSSVGVPLDPPFGIQVPAGRLQAIRADRHGNFALLWSEGDRLRMRLFNSHLVPQLLAVDVGARGFSPDWTGLAAELALGDTGGLGTFWAGPVTRDVPGVVRRPILGRIWYARHDDEPCVYQNGVFLCDTGSDGGDADEAIAFGRPGDISNIPLLGDYDGDGRDDPCLYRGGRFLCDTAHDGGTAEARSPRFGAPGDRPFLADLDGDGRDDPCVRRGNLFLCDTAHTGGAEPLRIAFGLPADIPLLGDMDGGGRDDPVTYRASRFLFLVDTAHDGGAAERRLGLEWGLASAAAQPLAGDINGDGRDDACLFEHQRLICGSFQLGAPPVPIERYFEPGQIPILMGDLDGF